MNEKVVSLLSAPQYVKNHNQQDSTGIENRLDYADDLDQICEQIHQLAVKYNFSIRDILMDLNYITIADDLVSEVLSHPEI